MEDRTSHVSGFLKYNGSVQQLRALLRTMGFAPSEGDTHHVSIKDFSHVMFREYSKSEYMIEADADSPEDMISDMRRLMLACSQHEVGYSIEIYDNEENLVLKEEKLYKA